MNDLINDNEDQEFLIVLKCATAYIGIICKIFENMGKDKISIKDLSFKSNVDYEYLIKWTQIASAFNFIENIDDEFVILTSNGKCLQMNNEKSRVPKILQGVYSVLIADKSLKYVSTGEQPGYSIVNEFENIISYSGYIFESLYLQTLSNEILELEYIKEIFQSLKGLLVDYGCGNGWFLKVIANKYRNITCLGIDSDRKVIENAKNSNIDKIMFECLDSIVSLEGKCKNIKMISLNRCYHHLGKQRKIVLRQLINAMDKDGYLFIWDFNPNNNGNISCNLSKELTFLNYIEHIQGNSFIKCEEVMKELNEEFGLRIQHSIINGGKDYIIIAQK